MTGSITVVPDKNGQITVHCDGRDIVITIGSSGGQVTATTDDDDPFSKWNRNVQFLSHWPDGEFSLKTLRSAHELVQLQRESSVSETEEAPAKISIIRIERSTAINLHDLHKIAEDSSRNVHVLIVPDRA